MFPLRAWTTSAAAPGLRGFPQRLTISQRQRFTQPVVKTAATLESDKQNSSSVTISAGKEIAANVIVGGSFYIKDENTGKWSKTSSGTNVTKNDPGILKSVKIQINDSTINTRLSILYLQKLSNIFCLIFTTTF